ncbi:MAG: hypothetical protein IKC50_07875, partial [Oscillospiraceae bacterium]|nr:hypothetical protein [Oscillospiraceae bacterium]
MDRVIEMEVVGYQIRRGNESLGAVGTGNAVVLRFRFDAAWDGLVKCAKFTDARGDGGITTEVELLTRDADGSYTVSVPREAMAYEGVAELSLIGELTENGSVTKRLTTKPLFLRVYASGADREAQNTEPITATDKQQILAKVDAAEGYARGTVDGLPVPERAEDNAKHYKEQAEIFAEAAATAVVEARDQAATVLDYRNSAQTFASQASTFSATAEARSIAAEAARKGAENAQAGAEAAQSLAEKARSEAQAAAVSVSASAQLIDHLNVHRYDAFPTETQGGADILHTDIGADGVPMKHLAVTVSSGKVPVSLTVKQMGKNIFNRQSVTLLYKKGFNLETGELESKAISCCSEQYFAVLPNKEYTFSGVAVTGTGYICRVYFYDADRKYIGYKSSLYDASLTFTTPVNCYWVRFALPQYVHSKYTGNADTDPAEGATGTIRTIFKVQLEFGAETAYEPYAETTQQLTVNELSTPTELLNVITTKLGVNVFEVERIEGVSTTMDVTYRVDPTLAFDKLKA